MYNEKEPEVFGRRYYELVRAAHFAGRIVLESMNAGQSLQAELRSYERRQYDELVSGLSEAIAGQVKTHYEFELDEQGRLTAQDGEPTRFMMNRALANARQMAAEDSFYDFMLERTQIESDELNQQEFMAKAEAGFNTLLTFSPYNEELAVDEISRQKLMIAGQAPAWRRSMLRISHWDGQKLHIITRSIDSSGVAVLRQAALQTEGLTYSFNARSANAMLAERIPRNMDLTGAENLADKITKTIDQILAGQNSGQDFEQGRRANRTDIAAYLDDQRPLISHLLKSGQELALAHAEFEDYKKAFDGAVYNCAALLEARIGAHINQPIHDYNVAAEAAGEIARAAGNQYSLCGHILRPSEQNTAAKTGFESLRRLEGKKVQCPECKVRVVVDSKDLSAGQLVCSHCGHGVDVCTGRRFNRQKTTVNPKEPTPDIADLIAKAFRPETKIKT